MGNETGMSFDLIRRIEKVEDDLRSSVKIIRVLSRQLEKLGIKFRVTRKTLKEPIAEVCLFSDFSRSSYFSYLFLFNLLSEFEPYPDFILER